MKTKRTKKRTSGHQAKRVGVQRRVRPIVLKVTQAEWDRVSALLSRKRLPTAPEYAEILGQSRAAVILSNTFHGIPCEMEVA